MVRVVFGDFVEAVLNLIVGGEPRFIFRLVYLAEVFSCLDATIDPDVDLSQILVRS